MSKLMTLQDIVQATNGELIGNDCEFSNLSTDTRSISAGDLFVALKGENFDANKFLDVAQTNGACALVVESANANIDLSQVVVDDTVWALGKIAEMKRDQYEGCVVSITGSCGKTTVKGLLASIFEQAGPTVATKGNLNNHIGVPLTLMRLDESSQFAVVEMGASGLTEIAYLTSLAKPKIAIVLNVQPAHIGGFGSIENVAQEKGEIYSRLGDEGIAVINLDTPYAEKYRLATESSQQIFFTLRDGQLDEDSSKNEKENLLVGHAAGVDQKGRQLLQIEWQGKTAEVSIALPGQHNLSNALAAASCALAAGVKLETIKLGLEAFDGVNGRMQLKEGLRASTVIDDTYNANPASMKAALDYLSTKASPKIFIMGNMAELGDDFENYHREIGQYAAKQKVTRLFTFGDGGQFAADAFGYGAKHYDNKFDLVSEVLPLLDGSTTVLVKGSRSAQMETIVKDICEIGESE